MPDTKMPDGWKLSTLGEAILGKPQYGLTARSSTEKGRILYLRISDITDEGELKTEDLHYVDVNSDEVSKYKLHENDFLIARSGSVGRVYLHQDLGKPSVFASYLIRFRLNLNEVLPKFVFYWGLSPRFKREIKARRKIVAQPNINAKDYCKFRLLIPPLETQRRIISVLERAHKLKRMREQANQLTNKIIQSVFLKMFGHPVELASKYDSQKLEDLALKKKYAVSSGPFGSNLGTKDYVETGILVVRGTNIKTNEFDLSDCKYVTEKKAAELERSQADPRDLVVVAVGASGRACIIPNSIQRCILSQNCNKISLDESLAVPEYVCYLLNTEYFQSELNRITTDTVRKFLSLTNLAKFMIPLPSIDQQQRFADIFRKIDRLKQRQKEDSKEVNELFHSLMHKAFRGDLVV